MVWGGQEAHPEVWEGLGDPPKVPGGVEWPTRRSKRGREAQQNVQDGSGGKPGGS